MLTVQIISTQHQFTEEDNLTVFNMDLVTLKEVYVWLCRLSGALI